MQLSRMWWSSRIVVQPTRQDMSFRPAPPAISLRSWSRNARILLYLPSLGPTKPVIVTLQWLVNGFQVRSCKLWGLEISASGCRGRLWERRKWILGFHAHPHRKIHTKIICRGAIRPSSSHTIDKSGDCHCQSGRVCIIGNLGLKFSWNLQKTSASGSSIVAFNTPYSSPPHLKFARVPPIRRRQLD